MSDIYKSKDQLMRELDGMRCNLSDLENCRQEFERVQRRYRELLEAAPDAMIFVNSNYEIVMVNAQAETLFGYPPGELQGKILDTLIPERFRGHHKENVGFYFSNPRVRNMGSGLKIFGLRKDGSEFRADISLSPLRTDEGLLVTAAVRDITEQIDLQERLAQSEKFAALGRISANIAHELRNPLTAIGGFARRLLAGSGEGQTEKEYASFIVSEVQSLEKTLKYVLEYSRVTVPHLEKHDIRTLIKDALDNYEEASGEHSITVRTMIEDVPELLIDREQAGEAIGSLLSNAIDAMLSGGELTVSAAVRSMDSRRYVAIMIGDTGEGISQDMTERIFEPFFTTKISKRGIGLGLPITKKIVEDHGGFVAVESLLGKGTTFTLYFPVADSQGGQK